MDLMEKIVSLCKRRGFIFQGSEIYGGLAGTFDFGHFGVALKNNIKNTWWKKFVDGRTDMYGVDAAILMRQEVWQATGHVANFSDPMVECEKCKRRFREDQLDDKIKCADCGGKLGDAKQFNMMFQTKVGASEDSSAVSYLRPETAQGMFVNFKNTVDAFHPKLPFGMAQIGKAFRNEITPRDFIFRQREFEQMEIEYFVRPDAWSESFDMWQNLMHEWIEEIGIDTNKTTDLLVSDEDRAFYSKKTVDIEFEYPFGKKELFGLAYRTDYDLNTHKLEYVDEEQGSKMTPHVIEPSFGLDRAMLAVLISAYDETDPERPFLKFKPNIAPVICAVSPLLKNKPELVNYAKDKVYSMLKSEFGRVMWDDNGNIGKRYRRQDEIGTPFCIVIDFETLGENKENQENVDMKDTVTVRDRDTATQERVKVSELVSYLKSKLN
ncbi:MAG: glycine--tRNA ligase [bacterium]|nr:glycine--tRNA ligase [bacterium]